jgi:hypothetical protein
MAKTKITKATYSRKIDKNGKLTMALKSVSESPVRDSSVRDSDSDLEGYDSSYGIPRDDWKWHVNQVKNNGFENAIKPARGTAKRQKIIRVPKPQAKEGSEENPITID